MVRVSLLALCYRSHTQGISGRGSVHPLGEHPIRHMMSLVRCAGGPTSNLNHTLLTFHTGPEVTLKMYGLKGVFSRALALSVLTSLHHFIHRSIHPSVRPFVTLLLKSVKAPNSASAASRSRPMTMKLRLTCLSFKSSSVGHLKHTKVKCVFYMIPDEYHLILTIEHDLIPRSFLKGMSFGASHAFVSLVYIIMSQSTWQVTLALAKAIK